MSTHNMYLSRNKKDISIFQMKKAPYLLLWEQSDEGLHYHSLKYFKKQLPVH